MMNDYGCGKGGLDNSGFHYDDCAGGPCGWDLHIMVLIQTGIRY